MKIIITMAGRGSRFKKQGIDEEKHRLEIDGKTMFEWSMESLEDFFEEDFIFITRSSNEDSGFIQDKCRDLGISNVEIIEIDGLTDGQASTVLKAEDLIGKEESIAIYNIDTYIESGNIKKTQIKGDGNIPVFRADGEKWSFVRTEDGKVVELAEKERISELATVGFYHFNRFGDFKAAYRETSEEVKQEYGEVYIAPLYNWLLDNDRELSIQEIPKEEVHVLGTPEDVIEFWPEFKEIHSV